MKRLISISVFAVILSACSDHSRVNCERTKNKALGAVTVLGQVGGGRCG